MKLIPSPEPGRYRVRYSARGSDFGAAEQEAFARVMQSRETLSCGSERDAFEQVFAAHVGTQHAVAVSSCTVGIDLVLRTLGLRPGDNVVATPQTYQSTVSSLLGLPVEVRFGDIDPVTLCLSAASVERLCDARTRAILLTHYGGLCADMNAINAVARRIGAFVLEDCAHAHGALYHGRVPGSLGDAGVYSFQSMKNLSTLGQGGMIVCDDADRAARLRRLRAVEPDARFTPRAVIGIGQHPPDPPGPFTHAKNAFEEDCTWIGAAGTNATLSEPAAAVGKVQLRRLEEFMAERRRVREGLDEQLAQLPEIDRQRDPHGYRHANHLYTCFLRPGSPIDNRTLCAALDALGVEIQQRYFPLHLLPEWRARGGRYGQCPVTETLWFERQINLPIYPAMTSADVAFIGDAMAAALRRA